MAELDRLTPVLVPLAVYPIIAATIFTLIQAPKALLAKDKVKEYYDFYGKHVSMVHSIISLSLWFYVYFDRHGLDYSSLHDQTSCYVLGHSLGYFIYDMCFAEWFGIHDMAMRLHHAGSIIGSCFFYYETVGASITVICIAVEEISNPFILTRDILRLKGIESGLLYSLMEYSFAITFIFFRVFGAHMALTNTWMTEVTWIVRINMALVHCLGVYWTYIVLRLVSKKLRPAEGPANCCVEKFQNFLDFFKAKPVFLYTFIIAYCVGLPLLCADVLKTGFINIKYGDFIIIQKWIKNIIFWSLLKSFQEFASQILEAVSFYIDTEIDWSTYMQQISKFLNGERRYNMLEGDTGPLVYPAGYTYVYSILYYLTNQGTNLIRAQYIFLGIYVLNLTVVLKIYDKANVVWYLRLLLCLSYRIHSIYMLRMFNDPIAMLFVHVAILLLANQRFLSGIIFFSFALSIKMNILLYLPGLLLVIQLSRGPLWTVLCLVMVVGFQVVISLPFTMVDSAAYMAGAFDFSRQFMMKWSVNWQFLSTQTFSNPEFHKLLLGIHLLLLIIWLITKNLKYNPINWLTNFNMWAEKRTLTPASIVYAMFAVNICGIAVARSLHYQFYSWYFYSLPYFMSLAAYPILLIPLFFLFEVVYASFPPTPINSFWLLTAHCVMVLLVLTKGKTLEYEKASKAKIN